MLVTSKIVLKCLPVVFLFISISGFGQTTDLSLDQAVKEAVANNYGIQIAQKNAEIAKKRVTRGNADMLPSISIRASHNRSWSPSKTEFISNSDTSFTSKSQRSGANLLLRYTFFDGMAMFYNYDLLKENAQVMDLEARQSIESTISQTANAYLSAVAAQQQIELLRESLTYSSERLTQVTRQEKAGLSTKLDVLNARVSLAEDSTSVVESQLNYMSQFKTLLFLLGRSSFNDDLQLQTEFLIAQDLSLQGLNESANLSNVLIQKSGKNINISRLEYETYKAARYPELFINSNFGWTRSANNGSEFVKFNEGFGPSVEVGVSFNIFNGGKTNNQIQRGQLSIENKELEKKEVINMVNRDLQIEHENYLLRMQLVKLAESNLPTAELNYENSKKSYNLGVITNVELRQAQLDLIRFKNRINSAKIEVKRSEVELMRLSGLLLK